MALPLRKPEPSPLDLPEPSSREAEAIFRPVRGDDGELRIVKLPATIENLLDPRLEDQLTQSNDHLLIVVHLYDALKRYMERLASHLAVFSDLLLLYKRHGHRDVTPDIAVVEGLSPELVAALNAPGSDLESLDVVAEGARLRLVIEVVSTSTQAMREKDEVRNPPLFAALGVEDHVLVYPPMEDRPMRVVAQRLGASGQYVPNPPTFQGRILLRSVGLWLWVDPAESQVVLEHQVTGERFLTSKQEEAGRLEAERRLAEETAARRKARAGEESRGRSQRKGRTKESGYVGRARAAAGTAGR